MNQNSEIYKCIHDKLKKESDNGLLERNKMLIILGKVYHFPKESRQKVVKELEKEGLIKVISQITIEVK